MAATTETNLVNMALSKMGQKPIDNIDGTDANEQACALVYDQIRDELLSEGPEDGWDFAKFTYHGIDRQSATISSVANSATSGQITVTTSSAHGLVAGDMVTIDGSVYSDTYDVVSIGSTTSFDVTETFTTTDTGTAYWTSEDYFYRFAVPTCKKVLRVLVGGIELTDWKRRGDYILTNLESSEVDMEIIKAVTDVTLFPDEFVRVLILRLAIALHYRLTQDLNAIRLLEFELERAEAKAKAMDDRQKYTKPYSSSWVDAGHITDIIE